MKPCVSICKGVKEEDCVKPCSFVGKKYCRLSTSMKMEPPDCKVVPRKSVASKSDKKSDEKIDKKIDKSNTIKTESKTKKSILKNVTKKSNTVKSKTVRFKTKMVVQRPQKRPQKRAPLETLHENESNESKVQTLIRKRSARKIASYMMKTKNKRQAFFLKTICADSGACLALGTEKKKLIDFFEFDKFTYSNVITKTIGAPSMNGFVKRILYEREGYSAYAALKSSIKKDSDNLSYEYIVGKYLNNVSNKVPNFLDTYGLFHYTSKATHNEVMLRNRINKKLIPLNPEDFEKVCKNSAKECVLIQYLDNAKTVDDLYKDEVFVIEEMPYVFYQVYFALDLLREEFTHYDLHSNNVLVYEPIQDGYLEYHYHLPDKVVKFYSKYIVKMIDYGRCFFKGSMEYYDKVCKEKKCDPNCGLEFGFRTFFKNRAVERSFGGMNSLYKNESHDLKLIVSAKENLEKREFTIPDDMEKIIKDTIYHVGISERMGFSGTVEDLTHDNFIRNVSDAKDRFQKYIEDIGRIRRNKYMYRESTKIGEIHVYSDGRNLEFIKT